jgi:serine/threonine-protein kinase/endoribonuclease IRE1
LLCRINSIDDSSATHHGNVFKSGAQNRRDRRKRLVQLRANPAANSSPQAILPSTTPSLPPPSCIGKLEIFFKSVLGQGSHGTIVYKGRLENRDVAVKRLLREFTEVADKEIDLLIRSDEHSSVVRYFAKEFDGNFVYLALELCDCNLRQLVENNMWATYNIPTHGHPARPNLQGDAGMHVKRALQQLVDGVVYLHRLGIVHRDLKPLNVLVSSRMRLKISDMGLARKLEQDQSSFETVAGGSFGWRAAEQILGKKCNKSVDVFTIGCLLCVDSRFSPRLSFTHMKC